MSEFLSGRFLVPSLMVALFSVSAAAETKTCVMQKKFKAKKLSVDVGDSIEIVRTGKSTMTVRFKKKLHTVKKAAFAKICTETQEEEVVEPAEPLPLKIGVMPFVSRKYAKKKDAALYAKWQDELVAALSADRNEVTTLRTDEKELYYRDRNRRKTKAKLMERAKKSEATVFVRPEVKKSRSKYIVTLNVVDTESEDSTEAGEVTLTKDADPAWTAENLQPLVDALPKPPPPPVEEKVEEEEVPAEEPVAKAAVDKDDGAEATDSEGGGFVSPLFMWLGWGTLGLGAVTFVAAAVLGGIALADSFGVLPLVDGAKPVRDVRSFQTAIVTDSLWVTTAVLGLLGGTFLGLAWLFGPDDEPDVVARAQPGRLAPNRFALALE